MEIADITSSFFDNEDSINLFNYLLNKNIPIDKITLLPCTKMKNRINIQIILNDYKTVICPVRGLQSPWFAVTRQHVSDISKLTGDDVHEFSAYEEDYHKLFNFMWGDDIFKNIKLLKDKVSNIKKILVEENNNF